MSQLSHRSTIYFHPELHRKLRLKAATENRSISEIVNEAIALLASEDKEDISDIAKRAEEPTVSYADFVRSLKAERGL